MSRIVWIGFGMSLVSLQTARMLLPTQNTSLCRELERWFDERKIRPNIVHEFEDSAVVKVFGQAGEWLFAGPTAIESQIRKQYSVRPVGRITEVKERFYAISVERRGLEPRLRAAC